jgi:hypothetical protein
MAGADGAAGRRARGLHALAGFRAFDVAGDDAAMGTRALNARHLDASFLRQPPGQRRSEHAIARCELAARRWGFGARGAVPRGAASGLGFGRLRLGGAARLRLRCRRACRRRRGRFDVLALAASTAITWLTGTSAVPSGTTILAMVPSSTASTSMVALSVSISAMTSPDLTLSPPSSATWQGCPSPSWATAPA